MGIYFKMGNVAQPKELPIVKEPTRKLNEALDKIEVTLQVSGGPYILGVEPCYADVSIFAILTEVLAYTCFDKSALLAAHPMLATLLDNIGAQMSGWMDFRVREHQSGIKNTIEFFATSDERAGPSSTYSVHTDPNQLGEKEDLDFGFGFGGAED